MKKEKTYKKRKGFTLVELLATITVLSLVVGFVIYAAINYINDSKEKTYLVNINNVESIVEEYLIENSNRLFYLNSNNEYEYQCVTIKNLIDMDYFDNDITKSEIRKDRFISIDDYVYIERDIKTKSILKVDYDIDGNYSSICDNAVEAIGDIVFDVNPDLDVWSREKEVTVTYILKNLNDYNELKNYTYNWSESNDSKDTKKTVVINSNRVIDANIKNMGTSIINKSLVIEKIDNQGPTVSLGNYTSGYVKDKIVIPLIINDNASGVDYNSFTVSDIIVTVGGKNVNDISLSKCNSSGICNLTINNKNYDGNVVITINENLVFDRVIDEVKNGNSKIVLKPNVIFDNIKPTCSATKSNVGSESGVTITVTCSDNSGKCNVSSSRQTNVKNGTYNYTVTDKVGNTNSCSVTVNSYSCNPYQYACGSYACGTYPCGSYACGSYVCGTSGSYACACGTYNGVYMCMRCYSPLYCTSYCTSYCPSYCTAYCTAYKTCYN